MVRWLPERFRPTRQGQIDNHVANAAWAGGGLIISGIGGWLAFPASDREWVWYSLRVFLTLSFCWLLIALGRYLWTRSGLLPSKGVSRSSTDTLLALIYTPSVDLDGRRIVFRGRYGRSGRGLVAYVTYAHAGGYGITTTPFAVLTGNLNLREPRIKLTSISRFDRDEAVNVTVGTVTDADGGQQVLQWGDEHLNNTKVGITWGSYFGYVIFVENGGAEHAYPFAVVQRSVADKPGPATILSSDLLIAFLQMGRELEQEKR